MTAIINRTLREAGISIDDVKLFVCHQANGRILRSVANSLGLDEDRMMNTIGRVGNTSAASVPLALAEAADTGRLERGDLLVLCGFGAGGHTATVVWRW